MRNHLVTWRTVALCLSAFGCGGEVPDKDPTGLWAISMRPTGAENECHELVERDDTMIFRVGEPSEGVFLTQWIGLDEEWSSSLKELSCNASSCRLEAVLARETGSDSKLTNRHFRLSLGLQDDIYGDLTVIYRSSSGARSCTGDFWVTGRRTPE